MKYAFCITHRLFVAATLSAVLFTAGCKKNDTAVTPVETAPAIYSSSFESDADLAGWIGYGSYSLSSEAPTGGGTHSLAISGGCILPHAQKMLVVTGEPRNVSIRLWGKRLVGSGIVGLATKSNPGAGISFSIQDSVWKEYTSTSTLAVKAQDTLCLQMICGGFAAGSMLVDCVEIK